MLKKCEICGEEYEADVGMEFEGKFYCQDCFDDNFITCDDCGKIIPVDDSFEIQDHITHYVCNDCVHNSDNYFRCAECGEWFPTYNMVTIRHSDTMVCPDCADYHYHQCCHCGEYFDSDDGDWDDYDDFYCDDCRYNGYGGFPSDIIHAYHDGHNDKVTFYGGKDEGNTLFMGVELEIDEGLNPDETAYGITDALPEGFVRMEEDGSLHNGFENITQPATLEYHLSIADKYEKAFNIAKANGYTSHNAKTCGLHVHINRSFFGKDEDEREAPTAKLLYLFERFWDEMVIFSRRTPSQLNQWACRYETDAPTVAKNTKKDRFCYGRYYAVNLTNKDTIEFRMFRGTLKLSSYLATLELVHSMSIFAKEKTIKELHRISFEELLTSENLKQYWESAKARHN